MVDQYISETPQVRKLARQVVVGDFTNDQIIKEQKSAYTDISIFTHKFDWLSTDVEYESIQKLEQQLAAAYIIEYYGSGSPNEIAMVQSLRMEAEKKLLSIKDNMVEVSADEEDTLTRTEYKSWNLNSDLPYNSKLTAASTGIEGRHEPDT